MKSRFKFTAGPWNVNEGVEAFGPGVRETIDLETKVKKFAEIGLSGVQFHDDDAVPDMNNMSEKQIIDYAKDVKSMLDKYGMTAEFVAPRLWMDPHTTDGGFTSNSKEDYEAEGGTGPIHGCGGLSDPSISRTPWVRRTWFCGWPGRGPSVQRVRTRWRRSDS